MYPWSNDEDGIDGWANKETYNPDFFKRAVYWSCARNAVGNHRFLPFLGVKPDSKRIKFIASKGFKLENDTNTFKKDIVGNVLAIEVPMGFYLRQPMSKRTFMREQVGITLNYNMNNERGFFRFPEQNPFAIETVVNKRMNFLINIGVEIQHELDAGHFFSAGIVYRHGFGVPMSLNVLNDVDNASPKYLEMAYTGGYLGINLSFLFNLSNIKPQKGELFFD
jgi:hypothetical protein